MHWYLQCVQVAPLVSYGGLTHLQIRWYGGTGVRPLNGRSALVFLSNGVANFLPIVWRIKGINQFSQILPNFIQVCVHESIRTLPILSRFYSIKRKPTFSMMFFMCVHIRGTCFIYTRVTAAFGDLRSINLMPKWWNKTNHLF